MGLPFVWPREHCSVPAFVLKVSISQLTFERHCEALNKQLMDKCKPKPMYFHELRTSKGKVSPFC